MKLISCTSDKNSGGNFTTAMNPTLRLRTDKNYEIALMSSTICRGWPTISESLQNNKLQYRTSAVASWVDVTIPEGNYTVDLLNNYIKSVMKTAGHYSAGVDTAVAATNDDIYFINIGANIATGRVKITLSYNYQLRLAPTILGVTYKLNEVLGFVTTTLATNADFFGENVPDVNRGVNQVQIRSDLVATNGAYVNGVPANVLYSFTPNAAPYGFMTITPATFVFLPLSNEYIDKINFRVTDQSGNELTTGGESSTITIALRVASG